MSAAWNRSFPLREKACRKDPGSPGTEPAASGESAAPRGGGCIPGGLFVLFFEFFIGKNDRTDPALAACHGFFQIFLGQTGLPDHASEHFTGGIGIGFTHFEHQFVFFGIKLLNDLLGGPGHQTVPVARRGQIAGAELAGFAFRDCQSGFGGQFPEFGNGCRPVGLHEFFDFGVLGGEFFLELLHQHLPWPIGGAVAVAEAAGERPRHQFAHFLHGGAAVGLHEFFDFGDFAGIFFFQGIEHPLETFAATAFVAAHIIRRSGRSGGGGRFVGPERGRNDRGQQYGWEPCFERHNRFSSRNFTGFGLIQCCMT